MAAINPYLNFNGNTEEAFNFYKSVFGGAFSMFQRFKDTPHGANMSAEDQEKIMHVSLPIGKGTVLMATDVLESLGQAKVGGDNFSIAITPKQAIKAGLSAEIVSQYSETPKGEIKLVEDDLNRAFVEK